MLAIMYLTGLESIRYEINSEMELQAVILPTFVIGVVNVKLIGLVVCKLS